MDRKIKGLIVLFVSSLLFSTPSTFAEPVGQEKVLKVAHQFLKAEKNREERKLIKVVVKQLPKQRSLKGFEIDQLKEVRTKDVKLLAYVAEMQPEGFIIISADDCIRPILGYSFKGKFPFEGSKNNVLLDLVQWDVKARLNAMNSKSMEVATLAKTNNNSWNKLVSSENGFTQTPTAGDSQTQWPPDKDGWLDSNWDQREPFNSYCPLDDAYAQPCRCAPGCGAIAMAQILNYWRFPLRISFDPLADSYFSTSFMGTDWDGIRYRDIWIDNEHESLDFPSFSKLNNVLSYINYDDSEIWPYLCFATAVKIGTDFSWDGSASVPNTSSYLNLGYGSASCVINFFPGFYEKLADNMKLGQPAQLQIRKVLGEGHSVVVDGYKESGEFHLNFGGLGSDDDIWYFLPQDLPKGLNLVTYAIMDICPYPSWNQNGADTKNTRRTRYSGPEDHIVKWIVDTHMQDPSTRLENAIVGSGGNVYAFCKTSNILDPGRLFTITPHGAVENSVQIPAPAMNVSWPAQASTAGSPIYIAIKNKVYKISLGGNVELFYEDVVSSEVFQYPTQVDSNGNVYVTGWNKICSLDPNGGIRWSKSVPNSSSMDFCAGIAIDEERGRLYAKYYDPDNDIAHLWALNLYTANEAWDVPVPAVPSYMAAAGEPTIGDDGTIFVKFFNSIRAYNPDGSSKWTYSVNQSQEYLEPFVSLGTYNNLYIGGTNFAATPKYAYLRSIRISDKTLLWEFTKQYPSDSSSYDFLAPVVAYGNNMVYVVLRELSSPGYRKLYALRESENGATQLWEQEGADCILLGSTGSTYLLDRGSEKITALSGGQVGDPDGAGMGYTNNSAPSAPSNPTPSNGEPNLNYCEPLPLSWTCADPEGHPLKYDVYLGEGEALRLYAQNDWNDTNCVVTGLRPETGYLWKVVATDGQAVNEGPTCAFATKPAKTDLNDDGEVNFKDFSLMAAFWMESCSDPNWCDGSDLDRNGFVDFEDLFVFAKSWLKKNAYEVINLTKLTNGPLYECESAFNWDGTKIVYRYFNEPFAWNHCDIWTMNTNGSGQTRVTTDLNGEFNPSFVPDGRITYTKEFGSNDYDIWMVDANGSNPHSFIGGQYRQSSANWHLSGTRVAYCKEYQQDKSEIWIADMNGTPIGQLTNHSVDGLTQSNPVYSRSGNLIAYANYATSGEPSHMWIMDAVNGTGKQQVTFGTTSQIPMFWWSDDSCIGYIQDGKLWLHNISTGLDELFLALPSASIEGCDLSPDGTKLVLDLSDASGLHVWIGDVICEP